MDPCIILLRWERFQETTLLLQGVQSLTLKHLKQNGISHAITEYPELEGSHKDQNSNVQSCIKQTSGPRPSGHFAGNPYRKQAWSSQISAFTTVTHTTQLSPDTTSGNGFKGRIQMQEQSLEKYSICYHDTA